MTATTFPETGCCPVIELRQYTLKPGQRETLIELFERHFIESQEAVGMTLVGQFRDRHRPDRFVWLRGFGSMERRHAALDAFYGGPVWLSHRTEANDTMVDSDDVLLLRPARLELMFATERDRHTSDPTREPRIILAGIYGMAEPVDADALSRFEREVAPTLQDHGVNIEGVFVTESARNTFARLPVREGEHVLVWFGSLPGSEPALHSIRSLAADLRLSGVAPSILELEPTSRSRLGNGPHAARASKHDFDFLFGSWNIHNRYLKGRLRHSTEWVEFDARSTVEPLLDGFGHLDRYSAVRDGLPFEGITLRLFDPATGAWSIHWADTRDARTLLPPMAGRFIGAVGEFHGDETVEGRKVRCRFLWTRPTRDTARWEQAFSGDDGKTWETNWIMTFTRSKDSDSSLASRS